MKQQAGFTMIEILVATLVLTVGILGVAALQLTSFQTNQSAYARSQAIYITQDIFDRIRANPEGYRNTTTYDAFDSNVGGGLPADPACVVSNAGCSSLQMAQQDIREWSANFNNVFGAENYRPRLPNGRGLVTRNGTTNDFTATVSWDEKTWDDGARTVASRQVSITATVN